MIHKVLASLVLALMVAAVIACPEELEGFVLVEIDVIPPDSTSADSVLIAGRAVRSPPRSGELFVITVTGCSATVTDTSTSFGIFQVDVPLTPGAINELRLVAADRDGTQSPPWTHTVVHTGTTAASGAF
jgi:hypothetical protein